MDTQFTIGQRVVITFGSNVRSGRRLLWSKGQQVAATVGFVHRDGQADYEIRNAAGSLICTYLPGSKDRIEAAA